MNTGKNTEEVRPSAGRWEKRWTQDMIRKGTEFLTHSGKKVTAAEDMHEALDGSGIPVTYGTDGESYFAEDIMAAAVPDGKNVTDCTGAYTEKWNSAPWEALVGTVSEKTMDPDIAGADIVDGISEAFLMCRTPEAAAAADRCVQAFTGLSAENLEEEAEKRAAENRENG